MPSSRHRKNWILLTLSSDNDLALLKLLLVKCLVVIVRKTTNTEKDNTMTATQRELAQLVYQGCLSKAPVTPRLKQLEDNLDLAQMLQIWRLHGKV